MVETEDVGAVSGRHVESIVVAAEDDGARADVVLGRRIPGLSRRAARRLGLAGALRIDGRRAAPSARVATGQTIELALPGSTEPPPAPTVLSISPSFVYVSKPAGLHTVAHTPDQPGCLSTWVAHHHPECADASPDPRESGAVHRLDRATSGVVAFARGRDVWERAREAFAAGRVVKHYLALTSPPSHWPPEPAGALRGWIVADDPWAPAGFGPRGPAIRIRAPIGRAEVRTRMAVRLEGGSAATGVVPVSAPDRAPPDRERAPRDSRGVFALRLETGVRHQARVHLAWAGMPIVGDAVYGGAPAGRLHLHAFSLDLGGAFGDETRVTAAPGPRFFDPSP